MDLKVLENSGTTIKASDGVAMNQAFLKGQNGIVQGRLNDFAITYTSSRLNIASGHIVINGINIILEEDTYFNVSPTSVITKNYLICNIQASNEEITARLQLVSSYSYGSLVFNGETLEGELNYLLATIIIKPFGIDSLSINISNIEEKHLYEHNISIMDDTTPSSIQYIVYFSILNSYNTEYTSITDIAKDLYARGNNSQETALKASGRSDTDSFQVITSIDFENEDYDANYCESMIIGVYGTSNNTLMAVVATLREDDSPYVVTEAISSGYLQDTKIQIL